MLCEEFLGFCSPVTLYWRMSVCPPPPYSRTLATPLVYFSQQIYFFRRPDFEIVVSAPHLQLSLNQPRVQIHFLVIRNRDHLYQLISTTERYEQRYRINFIYTVACLEYQEAANRLALHTCILIKMILRI